MALLSLPHELLRGVASHLDAYELTVLGHVCRALRALSRDPTLLVHLDLPAIAAKHRRRPATSAALRCALARDTASFPGFTVCTRHLLTRSPMLRWLRLAWWPDCDLPALCPALHTLDAVLPGGVDYARLEAFMQSPHARHLRLRVRRLDIA